jgi:tetratricopeptide (TPR) repeat protein
LLIIDDLEQILAAPQPEQLLTPVKDAAGSRDAWRTSLAAVLTAFAAADTSSRLLLTSRYRFTLPDGRGRDLADRLLAVQLRPMRAEEQRKQWRAAARLNEQAGGGAPRPSDAPPTAAGGLARLALAAAGGNPGLQEILCRPLLAGEWEAATAAIDAVEHWKQSGQLPPEENAAQEFFRRIALTTYENALSADQRTQLRATTLFSEGLPAPRAALAAAGRALAVTDPPAALERLLNLGLVDGWGLIVGVEHAAANPLARPLAGAPLTADEQALLAAATLPPLHQGWREANGDFPVDQRAVEAARLARLVRPGAIPAMLLEAAAYPAGHYLFDSEHDAQRALALLQAALTQIEAQGGAPRPHFFRLAADCAERIGERQRQLELLEKGLRLTSTDRRAMAQLAATYAEATIARDGPDQALTRLRRALVVFEEVDDVRSRAVTMGQIADILQGRGETDEALRIRREDCLPVYERLNDVRERAVTLGQIADILQGRGETDEALRIHLEERLPIARRIQDMENLAHIRFACAHIRLERGGLQTAETQTIVDELAESFALLSKLQHADGIAVVGSLFGRVLAAVGLPKEAFAVLDQAAAAFARLKQEAQVAQIREIQAHLQQTV